MRADDLTRELDKALEALQWTEKHLTATNEGNAALHCNPKVFYSPLTTQVHAAVLSLERVIADLGSEAQEDEGTIPLDSHLEAAERAQQEIERLRAAVGRASVLAEGWLAAHGSAAFLVRAAGAELRDELDGERDEPCKTPGHRAHVGFTCAEVDQTKPYWNVRWSQEYAAARNGSEPEATHVRPALDGDARADNAFAHVRRDPRADDPSYDPVQGEGTGQMIGLLATVDADRMPPNQGPLTGIEVRDPCPHCEDCPLIPRALMDDHIRGYHPDVTIASHENGKAPATEATRNANVPEPDDWVTEECPHCEERLPRNRVDGHVSTAHADLPPCTATLASEHDGLLHCVFRAGHREGEYGSHHASAHEKSGRTVWADWAKGATPHREPDQAAVALTPPDGGLAEDGLRRRCEELQARLDDAEEGITAAIRQRKDAEDRAHTADRIRAEAQRDRDQHAAVLREVLATFDCVKSLPDGEVLGYQGKAIAPEDFDRWRSVVAPTVERPWWETVAELRAAIERVRAIPRLPHSSQQTGELGRAYTRGWESVISALDTALQGVEPIQACPYCTGAPQFPLHELGAHIEEKHTRVLAALAVGNLDEQLADPETRCRLPHEMEA